MTRLGALLLYTRDVTAKLAFYERAFGAERKFVADGGSYGELAGEVPLGFVQEDFAAGNAGEFTRARPDGTPAAFEVCFVFDDVPAAYARAVAAGCTALREPATKPWGQTVAYVRDDDGVLVELATPWST
ncbi:MAG: VOC family protein [Kofleriaceae bacterium]|nr:VOC family protein [Myxococcales bacterium]MCB9559688.1 VOC family protein [Kofleriaceae bacterium]